ncbi:Dihydroxy-acid dehydratase 3, partial [Frankliniella fusca]
IVACSVKSPFVYGGSTLPGSSGWLYGHVRRHVTCAHVNFRSTINYSTSLFTFEECNGMKGVLAI